MTSERLLVSVVLPTYNDSDYLDLAVQSVVRQTYSNWELVIVDDGSTDRTPASVATYKDPRIRYVRSEVNRGVAVAQNTGIEHATGDVVVFLHSDDELHPDMLAREIALLDASSPRTVDGVQSAVEVRFADRTEVWPPTLQGLQPSDLLWPRTRIHLSGLMVRRSLAKDVGFDVHLRGAEDRDFCLRLVGRARLVFTPETLGRVVKRPVSLRSQPMAPPYRVLLEKYRDEIEVNRRLHAEWEFRIARACARAGEYSEARQSLRRAVRLVPWKVSRSLLLVVSLAGNAATRAGFSTYVRLSRARMGARQ